MAGDRLTEDDIREIRRRYRNWFAARWDSPTALSGCFGLSRESIYRIVNFQTYAWVRDEVDTLHIMEIEELCESDGNISEESPCHENQSANS